MKSFKYILTAAIFLSAVAATTGVSAKSKMVPRIYMFGFSASFTDSIVYFTNVQAVDSAWVESKGNYLLGRDNYSYQLKNYFTDMQNMPNRTCVRGFLREEKRSRGETDEDETQVYSESQDTVRSALHNRQRLQVQGRRHDAI